MSPADDPTGDDARNDTTAPDRDPGTDGDPEPMRRFPVPDVEDLPDDLRERIEAETERAGFTPNVFLAYGYRPEHFRHFFGWYDTLVDDSPLAREEIEMIIVAVSGVNDCYYCNVAHGALVRIYADAPMLADQLVADYRTADVGEGHRAMLDLAVKLTEDPAAVDEVDLDRLREAGFSAEAIWDVGMVASFFNLSNRMAHLADMRPNPEFHTMGR